VPVRNWDVRAARMHGHGEIAVGERFVHTSIIGSHFDSVIESRTSVGGIDAVVPSVAGQAWITDITQVGINPTAPFPRAIPCPTHGWDQSGLGQASISRLTRSPGAITVSWTATPANVTPFRFRNHWRADRRLTAPRGRCSRSIPGA